MRMLLLAAVASLALAGCTTTDPTTGQAIKVNDVQSAATAACRFLPTVETVADLLKVDDTRFTSAAAIAGAICGALNPNTPAGVMTLFKAAPTVSGVVIRGRFVE